MSILHLSVSNRGNVAIGRLTNSLPVERDDLVPSRPEWRRVVIAATQSKAFWVSAREMREIMLDPVPLVLLDNLHPRFLRD